MFLTCFYLNAEDWKLAQAFNDFIKMTIYQDLAIFNSVHLPFLIVPYAPFQKNTL